MTSHYDREVVLKRIRERRLRRQSPAANNRFLNIYLWVFVFVAAALVLTLSVWLFL